LVRGGRHQRGGAQGLGREMKALHDRQDDDAWRKYGEVRNQMSSFLA